MTGTDTIALPRSDALALENVLDMDDTSVADAFDAHFGYPAPSTGLHAETLHALLTASAEHSQKAEIPGRSCAPPSPTAFGL